MKLTDSAQIRDAILRKSMPEPNSGCWIWAADYDKDGHPRISIGRKWKRATRISYTFFHGDPGPLLVCHKCDTIQCVNPTHLFLGTNSDNARDRASKGRSHKRPSWPEIKLNREKARMIRESKSTTTELAAQFGVSRTAINHVKSGRSWK